MISFVWASDEKTFPYAPIKLCNTYRLYPTKDFRLNSFADLKLKASRRGGDTQSTLTFPYISQQLNESNDERMSQ